MIDEANLAITELEDRIRRANDRRYAFYRMLHATDRVLWKLEEMNRDGVKAIPVGLREVIRDELAELPVSAACAFRDSDAVQDMLDSVFEVQERLFRWKDPAHEGDGDEEERLVG